MMFAKPSTAARKRQKLERRAKTVKHENTNKASVRRRDRFCRFPLCGCRKLGLKLDARREVSHQRHKGAGGNPSGDRSTDAEMLLLCKHRHQDGIISLHKGTLKARYLTDKRANGPIAWDVDAARIWPTAGERWIEVAREKAVQQLELLTPRQQVILERLAEMEL